MHMNLILPQERRFLSAVSKLAYCNPFLPERTEYEQIALGRDYVASEAVWSASVEEPDANSPNVARLHARLEPLIEKLRLRLTENPEVPPEDLVLYEECVHHLLYQRYYREFVRATSDWRFYERFAADWARFFADGPERFATAHEPEHVFACFRQIQRAFHLIFDHIIGNSMPAARLRASVWQSVFSHDLRRYRRTLYSRMPDFPTLITGESGTGKELVARAIAGSRYLKFDAARHRFDEPAHETFIPINVAALPSELIESELFGHLRGSFTGAIKDRQGWLDVCPPAGSVFLDEVGEMQLSVQVKLLRVIETRKFSAVGDTKVREFSGKLLAATNVDLRAEIRAGRFREDLYYRLCADLIRTPSLRQQIEDSPEVLDDLILFMAQRTVKDDAVRCFAEVKSWIEEHLPPGYGWPGNYRELEQCVRNVIIRRSYQPINNVAESTEDHFYARFRRGELTMDELVAYYASLVYQKTGSYEETARVVGLDRRTVKAKVESFLKRAVN